MDYRLGGGGKAGEGNVTQDGIQAAGKGVENGKRKRITFAVVKALGLDNSCPTELYFWRKSICFL